MVLNRLRGKWYIAATYEPLYPYIKVLLSDGLIVTLHWDGKVYSTYVDNGLDSIGVIGIEYVMASKALFC